MKSHLFSGTGVALVTPFTEEGAVDYNSLTNIVKHVIKGKVDYLVVMGTTGESVVLSKEERESVINHILDVNDGDCSVVLGIGGNNTATVAAQIEAQNFDGISGILSVSPYYNKPSQDGIYAHYKEIARVCPVPIILYNVPGRTASMISPETTLRLAGDFENIVASKEASGDLDAIMEIIRNQPEGFAVISGDDAIALPLMSLGAQGVISVLANGFPSEVSSLIRLGLEGEFEEARKIHYELTELIKYIFLDGNPAGIKAVLNHLELAEKFVRLPLLPVQIKTDQKIKELCKGIIKS